MYTYNRIYNVSLKKMTSLDIDSLMVPCMQIVESMLEVLSKDIIYPNMWFYAKKIF